jgi:hypothetical protein
LGRAPNECAFDASPVGVRAVCVIFAFYATTLLHVAIRNAAVVTVYVEGTVVNTQTNIRVTMRLVGTNTAGRAIHCSTSVSRSGAVVALTVRTAVRERRLAIRVG